MFAYSLDDVMHYRTTVLRSCRFYECMTYPHFYERKKACLKKLIEFSKIGSLLRQQFIAFLFLTIDYCIVLESIRSNHVTEVHNFDRKLICRVLLFTDSTKYWSVNCSVFNTFEAKILAAVSIASVRSKLT